METETVGSGVRMDKRVRAISSEVAAKCNLPPFPKVATRAIQLVDEPDASMDVIVRVVATDAALAARVLKISRSATYTRHEPPQTLQRAIVTVGLNTLRWVLTAASVRSVFPPGDQIAERLWNHALATALACDELARLAGEPPGGESFALGLLHDVGKLVFYLSDKNAFPSLGTYDPEAEQQVFGVTHPVIGAYLVEMWGLESEFANAILDHHEPAIEGLAGRVARADYIAGLVGCTSVPTDTMPSPTFEDETLDFEALAKSVHGRLEAERTLFA